MGVFGTALLLLVAGYLALAAICTPLVLWMCHRAELIEERAEFEAEFAAFLADLPTTTDCPERETYR